MTSDPTKSASAWLALLADCLMRKDAAAAAALFGEDCYWRDILAFTWNLKTLEGRDEISSMLATCLPQVQPSAFMLDGEASSAGETVDAWFRFETAAGLGKGHVRLKNGKGFTLLTTLQELKGHEEKRGGSRDKGIHHGAKKNRATWKERRDQEVRSLGITEQPYCLIIGGGQGGLMLAARLKMLGVPTLIIEKNVKIGDSWRNRYRTLVLHDPVWYDHFPYLPFPDHWPIFTPKDKMGDWLESYASIMELNCWTSAEVTHAAYDQTARQWQVKVSRDGKDFVIKPQQLVFATGSYGPPRFVDIPDSASFGGALMHSSQYPGGEQFKGKHCIVLGANSSAHDICADLWEHGADVTMIQRTPTTVVRSETLMELGFKSLYSEEALAAGIDVDKADMIFASLSFRLLPHAQRAMYAEIALQDADLIARLNKAGFMTDYGLDGSGLLMKALRTGSGYYIDVGCSELIASGEVKVRSGVEIARFNGGSAVLSDGTTLAADVVIQATGYLPMNEWVAKIVSRETADLIGPNWGYGSGTRGDPGPWQGELRNMWKPMRQEALWFHGGNLHLSRFYSKFVALQLKARMEGIPTPVY